MTEDQQLHADGGDFDRFFRLEQPKMVALAAVLTGVPEVGRDIAQDALLEAYRAWETVSRLDAPGAWLRRVTINRSISWQRSVRRAERAQHRLLQPPISDGPEAESKQFWDAVRALPERQREVVALFYLEDRSVAQVAEVLSIADGTVKATLHAARRTLSAALGLDPEDHS